MLRRHVDVDYVDCCDGLSPADLGKRIRGKQAVISQLTDRFDAALIGGLEGLRAICNVAVGFDNIDLAAATASGIFVTNTPDVLTDTTADFAFALLLGTARRVVEADQFVRSGQWRNWSIDLLVGDDVYHRTLGIFGMGRIGQAMARRAAGFSMRILYHDAGRAPQELEESLDLEFVSAEELLRRSDFVTLHVPLLPHTRHLIGAAQLRMMKPTAILVNTSRGPVVDEEALAEALQQRIIAGAGLDVFEYEPNVHPMLLQLDNVTLAPHIASASNDTRRKMSLMAAENALAAVEGRCPPNALNPIAARPLPTEGVNRRNFIAGCVTAFAVAKAADRSELQTRLAADHHRPQYHFLPPANWMNDPNGPIFWRRKSHVFYQYNPNGAFSGSKHWGHAVTEDLVHWKNLPIALAPTPGGPDKDGVYTGCAVIDNGTPTLVFTGVRPEVQMIATSSDPDMISWTKYDGNPVIAAPPPGLQVTGFRDPCVWKEDGVWYMAVGSGFKGIGGAALLYRSRDLRKWEYLHPLVVGKMDKNATGSVVATGEMWECPDFFPLGSKYVLLVSTLGTVVYMVGSYKDHRFHPETEGRADFGCDYAPKTMLDGRGRRVWWGWIRERRSVDAQKAAGWSGVMSLPRILSIGPDGTLQMEPAPELERLRGKRQRVRNRAINPGGVELIKGISGDCLEIVAEIDPGDSEEAGLQVRCSPDGREQTLIAYSRKDNSLFSDATRSSQDPATTRAVQKGRLALRPGEPLRLRVFLDGSVVEVFANGRACLTDRTYPVKPESIGLRLHATGGHARLRSMDVWKMRPISSDRMTST